MALFQSAGILPCCKEAEKRRNGLGVSSSAINLRYLEGKPSGPAAFDGSGDFNNGHKDAYSQRNNSTS